MCDPISIAAVAVGTVAAKSLLTPSMPGYTPGPDPAKERAAAEATAAAEANNKAASDKRARQANALALGGPGDQLGGGTPNNVLSAGATPAQRSLAVAGPTVTALGGGAPLASARVRTPQTPTRASSV